MHCESVSSGTWDTDGLQIPISKILPYGNRYMPGNFCGVVQVEWYAFRRIPARHWGDTNDRSLVLLYL